MPTFTVSLTLTMLPSPCDTTYLLMKIFISVSRVYIMEITNCIENPCVQLNMIMLYTGTCTGSIKTHGSESRGQEEAACMRVFWPTRPLQ